jgi:hypothetical protein
MMMMVMMVMGLRQMQKPSSCSSPILYDHCRLPTRQTLGDPSSYCSVLSLPRCQCPDLGRRQTIPGEGYPAHLGRTMAVGPVAGRAMHSALQTAANEGIQIRTETLPWLPAMRYIKRGMIGEDIVISKTLFERTFICESSDLDSNPRSRN